MSPPIPAPRIVPVDEFSLIRKLDDLAEEPLVPPQSELIITQTGQQVISSFSFQIDPNKNKGKKTMLGSNSSVKPSKNSKGWSKEKMMQALEESIQIHTLIYNPNPMLSISSFFQEGILHDINFVPFMSFVILENDSEQLDMSISPHGRFYGLHL